MTKMLNPVWISGLLLAATFVQASGEPNGPRQRFSLDLDWSFLKGEAPGAENPGFDDKEWRTLDVPHDWSIEGPYAQTNSTAGPGGFLPTGIGWYRKHFTTPLAFKDKRVAVQFDGVYMNAAVYLNGHEVGGHHTAIPASPAN